MPSCRTRLLLLLSASPAVAGAQQAATPATVAAMTRSLTAEGLVGATWSTVDPARGVSLGAAGRRRADRPALLHPDDRVQVGSVAKTLIATGILRLVTEGKLRLDTPVATILPDVPIRNPWGATHPLLLRHLLDHTSGLDDARLWQLFNAEPQPATPLRAGFDPSRLRLELRQPPGDRFSYSNTGYGLLGLIVEAVSGDRYESYLDEHLLRPLGMVNSTFAFVTQQGSGADARLAMGHFEAGALAPAVPTYLRPAMQFTTTAHDMARLAQFLMGDGRVGGEPFVDGALLGAMGSPTGTMAARAGLTAGYALGIGIRDRMGVVGRCHGGNTVGYRAMFCLYPAQQKAFFVAMNADDEDANYARLDSLVFATLALEPTPPAPVQEATIDPSSWHGVYVIRPPRFQMLAYVDEVLDFIQVRSDSAGVTLAPFQGTGVVLEPVGGALFRAPGRTAASHVLLTTTEGNRAVSDGLRTWERVSLWRMVPLWLSLVAGAMGLAVILLRGAYLAARRRLGARNPLFTPFLAVLALTACVVLLAQQSVLQLGDHTATNVLLAVTTGLLPLALMVGLWEFVRLGPPRRRIAGDALAIAAVLQWTVVLAVWGLVPLRLWR